MTSAGWLEGLLTESASVVVGRFSAEGAIRWANARLTAMVRDLPGPARLPELVIDGQREEVHRLLRERQVMTAPQYLHFVRGEAPPITFLVRWQWEDDVLLLAGEPPAQELEQSQAALVRLNNRVSELARENAKKSAELEKVLTELRETQAMLVHREKMAALGQMTAGVAHELNNPLAFVKNNHYLLERALADLLELVGLFGKCLDGLQKDRPDLFAAITAKAEEIDLPHLGESVPRLLDSLGRGVDRVTSLVLQLRTFSRLDEAEFKEVDLNESLRAVVDIAGFLMRENETVFSAEYGALPPVTCSPGQLNQAVLNILTNAVQAAGKGGRAALSTRVEGDEILIEVSDSGPGVPEELRRRIFEPFFTTKPVGQGTGLGLSIAHSVVSEHGGKIDLKAGPDGGAAFTVRIPVRRMSMAGAS